MGRAWHGGGGGRGLRGSLRLLRRPSLAEGSDHHQPMSSTKHVRNAKSWHAWTRLPSGGVNNRAVGIGSLERRPVMCRPRPRVIRKCVWVAVLGPQMDLVVSHNLS